MTDRHTYTSTSGSKLLLRLREQDPLAQGSPRLFLMVDGRGMFIPTADLLAMIDAADPDAMRAYLRETAPEVIADLYRPEIPEADSPEDIDERTLPLPVKVQRALDHSASAVTAHAATLDNAAAAIEYVLEIRGTIR